VSKGVSTIIIRGFDIEMFALAIHKYKTTLLAMVPPVILLLAKHPAFDKFDFSVRVPCIKRYLLSTKGNMYRVSKLLHRGVHHSAQTSHEKLRRVYASSDPRPWLYKARGTLFLELKISLLI
jgi:hypothetical protein